MAISISDLKRMKATLPPRNLIYGPPGMGKTTLANEWPNAAFCQIEDGTPGDLELSSFGKLSSYDDVMGAIAALYTEDHDRQTIVIDSLDKLEPLVWAKVCADNNWANIEAPGYGRGYVNADNYWRDLLDGCNALRRDKGMGVVYIAHSHVVNAPDPTTVEYPRYDIRLHKRAIAIFQDEVDNIFFLNQDVTIKSDDPKNKQARVRGDGGGNRWCYTTPRPAFVAKNRYGVPDKFMYERGKGYAALAEHFPKVKTEYQISIVSDRFLIEYVDKKTGQEMSVEKEFSSERVEGADEVSTEQLANDWAKSVAKKDHYSVTRIEPQREAAE